MPLPPNPAVHDQTVLPIEPLEEPASQVAQRIIANYGRLIRIMQCRLRDRELAIESINEASAIALEHARAGRLVASATVPGYVLGIAGNVLRNRRRDPDNHHPELRAEDAALLELARSEEESALARERLEQSVRAVIAALGSARDREIVKRFYLDEELKEAICREMRVSPPLFDKVVFRARQRMTALLSTLGFRKGRLN